MKKKKISFSEIVGIILVISLAVSVVYSFIRLLGAPVEIPEGEPYTKVKSDYLLMLVECILGLLVCMLPSILSRRLKIILPNVIYLLFFLFLYCAIFLGEVFSFYYIIPHWDTMLHAFSGASLGALGFVLVDILNKDEHVKLSMTPFFVSFFAFCFALAMGALWEIYEFSFDSLLGLNMQKFRTETGEALVGKAALADTMKDLIVDASAALFAAVIGFFSNMKRKKAGPVDQPDVVDVFKNT